MTSLPFGKRLLPQVVDHYAHTQPDRVYACIPRSAVISDGFKDITMKHMAKMVNQMSWWLCETLEDWKPSTIAYMGIADLRYAIILLGAIKCGHAMLLISPRNTVTQRVGMLHRTECTALLYAEELHSEAVEMSELQQNVQALIVPSFEEMFEGGQMKATPYEFSDSFENLRDRTCVILHSSGSTGDPKLVFMTHGTLAVTDNDRFMPTPEGRLPQNGAQFNFNGGGRFFSAFPPYHLAGFQALVIQPIFSTTATVVLSPPMLSPSGRMLTEIMEQLPLRAIYVPPVIVEQWANLPGSLEQAKSLDFILFGGGPLSPKIGDALDPVTSVCQMFGSVEIGQVQLLIPQPGEWSYLELNPFEEADMQPSADGLFEMVLHQDPTFAERRSLWHNFPKVSSWRTGDLFTPHPSKSGLWRFHSRIDDVLVLSTGYKIRPLEIETIVQGDPLLSGALMVGNGKPRPLLLVEPKVGVHSGDDEAFVTRIWPTIEQSNKVASSYGQIAQSRVVVADPKLPFKRAPKGSIIRKATTADYQARIDATCARLDHLKERKIRARMA